MRFIYRGWFLTIGLMLPVSGCSPWQTVNVSSFLEYPERGAIRVTTVYGDTYEGGVRDETTKERLVMELRDPSDNSRLSGIILSIPKEKVTQILRWVPIY
jgi:hypothetical protein